MLNKCSFIGNLGRDPEARTMNDGSPVVNLSVGVTEKWRDKSSGEQKERTEWIRVVLFNEHLAKFAQNYLKKGSKIYVEGKMQTRKWTDQSGVEKYTTEIVAQKYQGELKSLDSRSDNQQSNQCGVDALDDEIPF